MARVLESVMFDAGGVLWDLRPSPEDMFLDMLARHGSPVERPRLREAMNNADRVLDEDFAKLEVRDETMFWRRYDRVVLDELGVDLDAEPFARDLSTELRDTFAKVESWVAFPDAVPALEKVRAEGLRVGLVSNASELARRVLRNLDMERFFDAIVISDEIGVRKPDPRIFRTALGMIGTDPSRAAFLGDKPSTDIAGATAVGMMGVLVDRRGAFPDTCYQRITNLDELDTIL